MKGNEVEAAAGGMLGGLLLLWFLVLGCLTHRGPIAVGVHARLSLVEVRPSWWGRIQLREKSKAGNFMVQSQHVHVGMPSDFVVMGSSLLDYWPVFLSVEKNKIYSLELLFSI